jgi:hypothetical protein
MIYVDQFTYPKSIASAKESSTADMLGNGLRKLSSAQLVIFNARAIYRHICTLADGDSRNIFIELLVYLTFHMDNGLGEEIRLWETDYGDCRLKLISSRYALYWMRHSDQYYFQRVGVRIRPGTRRGRNRRRCLYRRDRDQIRPRRRRERPCLLVRPFRRTR